MKSVNCLIFPCSTFFQKRLVYKLNFFRFEDGSYICLEFWDFWGIGLFFYPVTKLVREEFLIIYPPIRVFYMSCNNQ